MFRLAASGSGKRAIVRIMTARGIPPITGGKKWDSTYVGRVLLSPAVLGERVSLLASRNQPNDEVRTNYYPAVVDAELWQAAQAAISARRGKAADGKTTGRLTDADWLQFNYNQDPELQHNIHLFRFEGSDLPSL
jgi:hypothetical protein